ncbi:ribonuclease kappa isoform X1 [Chrysemys picta bellii]|uniref:ribonuclease kappa isoform X1 n=1 Tax=Chrysemys picta bellii TaxID=8478 RepID=UPI0032B179D3
MASLLCCGPKLAACGIVLSAWGVIMLILLGIFFNVHSAILIEDVPFTEEDFKDGPERAELPWEQSCSNQSQRGQTSSQEAGQSWEQSHRSSLQSRPVLGVELQQPEPEGPEKQPRELKAEQQQQPC